jgi:hypothetical protein
MRLLLLLTTLRTDRHWAVDGRQRADPPVVRPQVDANSSILDDFTPFLVESMAEIAIDIDPARLTSAHSRTTSAGCLSTRSCLGTGEAVLPPHAQLASCWSGASCPSIADFDFVIETDDGPRFVPRHEETPDQVELRSDVSQRPARVIPESRCEQCGDVL